MFSIFSNSSLSLTSFQNESRKAVNVNNVCVKYPEMNSDALSNITLDISNGLAVALIGANGSGKSTFLKAVAGHIPIKSGELLVYGNDPKKSRNRISYLAQRSEIDWSFPITVRNLILTGCYSQIGWGYRPSKINYSLADELLSHLGLQNLSEMLIGELSGGQQQRVLVARSLMQKADLLLLDEPFNAIDIESKTIIEQIIRELRASGKTIIVATHDIKISDKNFDQAIHLYKGIAITQNCINELSKDTLLWNH